MQSFTKESPQYSDDISAAHDNDILDYLIPHRCDHRHVPVDPFQAVEDDAGNFSFPMGDCQLIGNDGKIVKIHSLHAASMSQFLAVALLSGNFSEGGNKVIRFPLFTGKEIVNVLELSNYVVHYWLEHHEVPDLEDLLRRYTCGFNILPISTFFQLDLLTSALALFIEKYCPIERTIDAYRLAQVTDAALAERLWRQILTCFPELYKSGAYLSLTPEEIIECFTNNKLNVKVSQDKQILLEYKLHNRRQFANAATTQKFDALIEVERIGTCEDAQKERVPHEVIIAQAGWGENGPTKNIEIYDYHRDNWFSSEDLHLMEEIRAYHGLVVMENGLMTMGGFNGRTYYRSASFYDFPTMKWKPICSMVEPRCYVSLAKLNSNQVMSCGGYTGLTRLRTTEIYNVEKNQWYRSANMNLIRSDSRAVVLPNTNVLFMVGGFDGRNCHRSAEYYDIHRDAWILAEKPMETKRSGVGAIAISEAAFLAVGGFNGQERLTSTELYDVREGIWHSMVSMNLARSNFGHAFINNQAWVMGGYNSDHTVAECELFDIKMGKWIQAPTMRQSRSALACCVVENVDWIEKILYPIKEADMPSAVNGIIQGDINIIEME